MTEPPGGSLYERLRRLGVVSWSIFGALVLLSFLVWVAIRIQIIWAPLIFAVIIIYLLKPLVDWLMKVRVPRVVGAFIAYLLFGGVLFVLALLVIPLVREQWTDLVDRLPGAVESIDQFISDLLGFFNISVEFEGLDALAQDIREWFSDPANRDVILNSLGVVWNIAVEVVHVVTIAILAPVLAFYILVDASNLTRAAHRMLPPTYRDEILHVSRKVARTVGGFIRGQLLVALIVGVLSSIALRVLNLPFWLIVGMMAGLLNIIPFIGPWVGGILGVSTALIVGEPAKAVGVAIAFLIIQQFDNHVVSPLVLRVAVRLSPATIVLSLLAGGSLWGILGVLIAVPFTGVIKVVVGHLWRTRILGEPWDKALESIVVEREPETIKQRIQRVRTRSGEDSDDKEDEELPEPSEQAQQGRQSGPDG